MNFKFLLTVITLSIFNSSCQISYYMKTAYNQLTMLSQKEPLEKALQNPEVSEEQKRKIRLADQARNFAADSLKLNSKHNYNHFVLLDQPYVTYVVNASEKWQLKNYLWDFAFIGEVPYKGFFKKVDAEEEQNKLDKKNYDTFVRGVSAYSTLGWLKDPLLSSMLNYSDHDLVNTVIHESVHATFYIKSSADFNERMAVYIGQIGMEMFYQQLEGEDSPTLKKAKLEGEDEKTFSEFISGEISELEKWYQNLPETERTEDLRQNRLNQISQNFTSKALPKMKTDLYQNFSSIKLNNARVGLYKTYNQDLHLFEKLYEKENKDFTRFFNKLLTLKKSNDPDKDLELLVMN